jgi:hypothetical protein
VLGWVVGVVIGVGRWEIWKHRHPAITPEEYASEYIAELRRNARWN